MSQLHPFRNTLWLSALFSALISPVLGKSPAEGKGKPQIRFVCVSILSEKQEIILATRDANEKWQELGNIELRASMISDWLPARSGETHLALREGGKLKSIGHFNCPADSSRGLVVLIADLEKKSYTARFVDPEKAKFEKGSALVFNFSTQASSVFLGPTEQKIEADQQVVVKPTLENNGMYRMQVNRPDKNNQPEVCYDRYLSGNQDSRELIFLLSDEKSGLKVMSIPMFADIK